MEGFSLTAENFINQYYLLLNKRSKRLINFYQNDAIIIFNGNFVRTFNSNKQFTLFQFLEDDKYKNFKFHRVHIISQPLIEASILITVQGLIRSSIDIDFEAVFNETFIITQDLTTESFFILNQNINYEFD